jgi:3-oxoacyl-[acyl-carrier-protein] synthase-3
MAIEASKKLFKEHNIDPKSINFILLCTQSPDYFLPTTSCIIQSKLGIPNNAGALDFNLGCSGYIYGLALSKGLISAGIASNILLITSETYSKYIHDLDRGNRTIFGDAASATLISNVEGMAEICDFELGTDGTGAENLIVKNGALKNPSREFKNSISDDNLYMNGSEIFSFTLDSIPSLVQKSLIKNKLDMNDIDLFIFHQANGFLIDYIINT